jgi:hypothetical protein
MIRALGFPAKNLAAIGYGEYHPLVPNDSPDHRAKNRRVVFFIKNKPTQFKPDRKAEAVKAPAEGAPAAEIAAADGEVEAAEAPVEESETAAEDALPLPQEPATTDD